MGSGAPTVLRGSWRRQQQFRHVTLGRLGGHGDAAPTQRSYGGLIQRSFPHRRRNHAEETGERRGDGGGETPAASAESAG
ncbi:hypothetical protein ATANTOWER_011190 [Ataeniobius toweri]|uniref:Uncharacterized protein n=1 Tax=Ataeniobius toweri TaxID=208326 RepID=A0ABU7BG33_9TELE|nr:hypothetical protein [Ataeniobius toweri]